MKFKTEKGVQVQLSEADIMQISKHNKSQFDSGKLTDYFHEIKEHAVKKLQHISERMITDQKDVYNNLACVMKHGTYQDAKITIKCQKNAKKFSKKHKSIEKYSFGVTNCKKIELFLSFFSFFIVLFEKVRHIISL